MIGGATYAINFDNRSRYRESRSFKCMAKTALAGRKRNASEFVCVCDMLGDFGVDNGGMRDRQHVTGRGQMPRLCAIDRGRKALHDPLSKIRREPA